MALPVQDLQPVAVVALVQSRLILELVVVSRGHTCVPGRDEVQFHGVGKGAIGLFHGPEQAEADDAALVHCAPGQEHRAFVTLGMEAAQFDARGILDGDVVLGGLLGEVFQGVQGAVGTIGVCGAIVGSGRVRRLAAGQGGGVGFGGEG